MPQRRKLKINKNLGLTSARIGKEPRKTIAGDAERVAESLIGKYRTKAIRSVAAAAGRASTKMPKRTIAQMAPKKKVVKKKKKTGFKIDRTYNYRNSTADYQTRRGDD